MNDVIARWQLTAHAAPAPSNVYDLLAVGGELAAEVGGLRERNAILEQATKQHVISFVELVAAQPCAWLETRRAECGAIDLPEPDLLTCLTPEDHQICLYCEARRVYELMRASQ